MLPRIAGLVILATLANSAFSAEASWRAKLSSPRFIAVANIYSMVYGHRDLCSTMLPELRSELDAAVAQIHEENADVMAVVMDSPDLDDAKASTAEFIEKTVRSVPESARSYCAKGAKGLLSDFSVYIGAFREMLGSSR
jgi:hypothetical protein